MAVEVERRGRRPVSEHLLDDLDVGAGCDRQRCCGVPERVRVWPGEPERVGGVREHCTLEHRGAQRASPDAADHEILGGRSAT